MGVKELGLGSFHSASPRKGGGFELIQEKSGRARRKPNSAMASATRSQPTSSRTYPPRACSTSSIKVTDLLGMRWRRNRSIAAARKRMTGATSRSFYRVALTVCLRTSGLFWLALSVMQHQQLRTS